MSTKSTLLLTNCCHIYRDYGANEDGTIDLDSEIMSIDVNYGVIDKGEGYIELEWESDFAAMIRHMIKTCGNDALDEFCTKHWKDNN